MSKKIFIPESELRAKYEIPHYTISQLARDYNVPTYMIRKHFKAYGIQFKAHKDVCAELNKKSNEKIINKNDFLHFYASHSLLDTRLHFNIGQEKFYELLELYDTERRTIGEGISLIKRKSWPELDESLIKSEIQKYQTVTEFCDALNISYKQFCEVKEKYGLSFECYRSKPEANLFDFCSSVSDSSWIANDRTIISPYELDIYSPKHKLAIEYCGVYWHSNIDPSYHKKKYDMCATAGISLLTIFDTDDINKVHRLIMHKLNLSDRIYARNTIVKPIDSKLASNWHNKFHMHGNNAASVHLGLFSKSGDLLQVASFGKSRYNKNYEYECNRSTIGDISVVGGTSKLFSYFFKNYSTSLISYADLRFGSGNVYEKCGMKRLDNTPPNYFYYKNGQLYSRVKFQKHKLKNILEEYDESLTEQENMKQNGYRIIYDCGNAKYVTQ